MVSSNWWYFCPLFAAAMVKDANKPKGRTSAYAFFVLSCREEHKKKSPGTSVNFAKFSKTCSERWKVCVCVLREHMSVWLTVCNMAVCVFRLWLLLRRRSLKTWRGLIRTATIGRWWTTFPRKAWVGWRRRRTPMLPNVPRKYSDHFIHADRSLQFTCVHSGSNQNIVRNRQLDV